MPEQRESFNGIKECPKCFSRLADTKSNGRSEDRGPGRKEWVEGDQFWVHCPACNFNGPVRATATKALRAWNNDKTVNA